jgi:hypothetical protein
VLSASRLLEDPSCARHDRYDLQHRETYTRNCQDILLHKMKHRNGGKGPRATAGRRSGPTPAVMASAIASAGTTPLSSAVPSAYQSEAEGESSTARIPAITRNFAALTLDVPLQNPDAFAPKKKVRKPFPLFELPSELRLRIYAYYFANVGETLDLDFDNHKRIHSKLAILRTCRQIYAEASYQFYSSHTVRLFPIYGKYFKSKKPLLARLKPNQRATLTTLELRVGPGWNRPPRGWVVNDALGLADCSNVRRLRVFVECDTSNDIFKGFLHSDGFYEGFCRELMGTVLDGLASCHVVEFDANPSVKKAGPMMTGLLEEATQRGKQLAWGPEKGWDDGDEKEEEVKVPNMGPIGRSKFSGTMLQGLSTTNGHVYVNDSHGHHSIMVLA